ALAKIGPIKLLGTVRSRSLLEHHRCEPERRDGHGSSVPLVAKLSQRRADEHSQTLIWCPNYRATGRSWVHRLLLPCRISALVCPHAVLGESPKLRPVRRA